MRRHRESIVVRAAPRVVYDLVSDVTRTGEWSPVCEACWWDEPPGPAGPTVGAWFTGRNRTPTRTWETRSQVVVAEPGREFAWEVAGGWVRWGYFLELELEPDADATHLTETWAFTDEGLAGFAEKYGADAEAQIEERTRAAVSGIPLTLARIGEILATV